MPTRAATPYGFTAIMLTELCVCRSYLMVALAFAALYCTICSYIWSCVEDLSMLVARSNHSLVVSKPVKEKLLQFIRLHLQCYRWCFRSRMCPSHVWILTANNLHISRIDRMMEMLERVMSAPIFFQIAIFGFQTAVCLYQIEHVSHSSHVRHTPANWSTW